MADTKLCLLLLLVTCVLAQQEAGSTEEQSPTCALSRRYKNFRKYVYHYQAKTHNGEENDSGVSNGPKVTCKVEIDVPQTCSFVLRTTDCSLSEVTGVDKVGKPVYGPAASADAFRAAMEKNLLKVIVEGEIKVTLYPDEEEPTNILNVKRGIVSSLLVPLMEEDKNKEMATIHGICETDFKVNARQDIATDVTLSRNLLECDHFTPRRDQTSSLALAGLPLVMSKWIKSSQLCNYHFDNQKKHMTAATCTEKHNFLFTSVLTDISSVVTQTLTLQETSKINDRVFNYNTANKKSLPMETSESKLPAQTKDNALASLRELAAISQTEQRHQRASTFQKLVAELRGLNLETLSSAVDDLSAVSTPLTWQALIQCGTPECSSAMIQILQTSEQPSPAVDAGVYGLGLLLNPSRLLVKDILAMARANPSRPIMYALSNVVRKLYQSEGVVTPEIVATSDFMNSILGADCSGDKEAIFLALRVIGNMGEAMEAADPSLKNTLLKCMRQPSTSLSVQQATIQAFRRMSVTDEVRSNLQRVCQYAKGAVQKRLAAYLILMRNPEDSDLEMVKKILTQEQNPQIKSFVSSHVYNIIHSEDANTQRLGQRIIEVLQDNEVNNLVDYTTLSGNYKMEAAMPTQENILSKVEGNVIFDTSSNLPREVMFETTLKAFGYNIDMWEVGLEGKGLEPTNEALFGKNGFFPDTVSKAIYWSEDKMSDKFKEVLEKWTTPLKTSGQKVPENLVKEIVRNFDKLMKDMEAHESPETMAYLRIMGNELGYIKGSELTGVAQTVAMYAEILFKTLPMKVMKSLTSGFDNEVFAHYLIMENQFSLPTAIGFPLKTSEAISLAPGIRGGLHIEPTRHELSSMFSIGVDFKRQMGVHVPEFAFSATELHISLYHESAFHVKISGSNNQVKISVPSPQGNIQLIRMSVQMETVKSGPAVAIPPSAEAQAINMQCSPLFSGVDFCFSEPNYKSLAGKGKAYFPDTTVPVILFQLQPTGKVTEYSATFEYDIASDGKDGRQKVDFIKVILKAEGEEPHEATAVVKYNRHRNMLTGSIQVPDFDIEAGLKVGVSDSGSKGRKLTIEISNKNVPQLSLIGRARLESMADAMLQLQLQVPSVRTDASVTATLNSGEKFIVALESTVKLPETSSVQKAILTYGPDNVEVELKSDMDCDVQKFLPNTEVIHNWLRQVSEEILDQKVVKTDMKLRHIYTKSLEAGNIWMDKIRGDFPQIDNLKSHMPELALPSMPERLFLNTDTKLKYQFNKDHVTLTIHLPLGGKTSEELKVPTTLTLPRMAVPQIGLDFNGRDVRVPSFTIPPSQEVTLPLIGMLEASAKVDSNLYSVEASVSIGNNTVEGPTSHIAQYKVEAKSPIELLAYKVEGTGLILYDPEVSVETVLNGSLSHKFFESSFSFVETAAGTDKMKSTSNYKVQASSPLGLQSSVDITSQLSMSMDMFTGDGTMDGSLTVGSMTSTATYSESISIDLVAKEARGESTLRVNSPLVQLRSKVKGGYAKEELLIESNTNILDPIKHTSKVTIGYKEARLTIQTDSVTKASERMFRHQVGLAATREEATIRMETQADDSANRVYSLLSGSLNSNGLEVNTDASANYKASRASHKAALTLNKDGLTTSCTTTAQSSPMTFENILHGGIDSTGASLSLNTKAAIQENSAELNVEGKVSTSEVYLNSMYKGNLFDANTRNRVNLKVNKDGLVASNNLVSSLQNMKTDNTNSLTLTFWAVDLVSKTDNFISEQNSYKHNIAINAELQGFTASVTVSNDLKVFDVNFINEAKLQAEPYKLDLTGTLKGTFAEEELRHTYELNYADRAVNSKCSTTGKLLGVQMSHNTDLEVAGFSSKFNSDTRFNSPSLRMDSAVHAEAKPYSLNVDALFNADGELNLFGKQTAQLYSKFLVKAEPMAFSHTHEYRASTTHKLEGGNSIEMSLDNKVISLVTPEEQSSMIKVKSKLNDHAFNQDFSVYNNHERIGMEVSGAVLTTLLNEASENREYAISGFLKYDKNAESHVIQLPFFENLPMAIEKVKINLKKLTDDALQFIMDLETKYEVKSKLQEKLGKLKQAYDSFDITFYVDYTRDFIKAIDVDLYAQNLIAGIPTEEIINTLNSIKQIIINWIKQNNIVKKYNEMYTKTEEMLSHYEIENRIEVVMDGLVNLMKQLKLREIVQSAVNALKSIDIQPVLNKVEVFKNEILRELKKYDLQQMIDSLIKHIERNFQTIKNFDYETVFVEASQTLDKMSRIPCFGKLYGEFRVNSPDYSLRTNAELKNSTSNKETPEFKASLKSEATSTFQLLAHTVTVTADLAVPKMRRLSVSKSVKVNHVAFSVDHQGSMTLHSKKAQASSKTIVEATTNLYTAKLVNSASFATESGISATQEITYSHHLKLPSVMSVHEASATIKSAALLEDGTTTLTFGDKGSRKLTVRGQVYDEGTGKHDLQIVLGMDTAKLTFTGASDTNSFKSKQSFNSEARLFSHISFDGRVESESPFIKSSVAEVKGQAQVENLNVELTASHNTELVGKVEGTISNSLTFSVRPYDFVFDTKNKKNIKINLPFKLSGKIDLQNDFAITLNSEVEQASWVGLARFNQYKYSHYVSMDNGEKEIHFFAQMNGEANLNVLTVPISIRSLPVPYTNFKTPAVKEFTFWEDAGFNLILTTTKQTLDLDAKLKYKKNSKKTAILINTESFVNAINKNSKMLNKNFILGRDKAIGFLATSMPSLNMPPALSQMTLPKPYLPKIPVTLLIPVMGDLTYDFSIKSASMSLTTNAGVFNREDAINKNAVAVATTLSVTPAGVELSQDLSMNAKEGLVISVSSPFAGFLGLQLQTKSSSQVNGRLFSRYPSEPTTDVDILDIKVSMVNSKKLNIQTSWNMEAPKEILLLMKDKVPAITSTLKNIMDRFITFAKGSVEKIKDQGLAIYSININASELTEMRNKLMDSIITTLKMYQKSLQTVTEAVLTFLRETKFQLPGFKEKLTGLEIYQKLSKCIADFTEEAIKKITEAFMSYSEALLDQVRSIKFTLPGTHNLVSGREVLDDLTSFLEKIHTQVISIVKQLGDVKLEFVVQKLQEFLHFANDKIEELFTSLKSQDFSKLSTFISDVYTDALKSPALHEITAQIEEARVVVKEYHDQVKSKLRDLFAGISLEKLNVDIQSWIDLLVKNLNAIQNRIIQILKEIFKDAQSFVTISDRKMDIDIPFPLLEKFHT